MLHTVLSVLGFRDQGVQLIQVGSHFLAEIDLLRLYAAVRGRIRDGLVRRLHRHHLVVHGFWLLLIFLLFRVGIRLLGLVARRSAARMYLPLEQCSQAAANILRNSLFHTQALLSLSLYLSR